MYIYYICSNVFVYIGAADILYVNTYPHTVPKTKLERNLLFIIIFFFPQDNNFVGMCILRLYITVSKCPGFFFPEIIEFLRFQTNESVIM